MKFSPLPLLLAPLLAAPSLAQAQDWLFIAGAETGTQYSNYGQAGVIAPLPGSSLGQGWMARLLVDGLTYRYEKNTTEFDATAFGASAALGWGEAGRDGRWGLFVGPTWRHTHLSPEDFGSEARGGKASLNFSFDGERNLTEQWRVNLIASYSAFAENAFWNRVRVMHRVRGEIFAGPEAVWQGSDEYRAAQVGFAVTGIPFGDRASLGFKVGLRKGKDIAAAPYVGVEFGMLF